MIEHVEHSRDGVTSARKQIEILEAQRQDIVTQLDQAQQALHREVLLYLDAPQDTLLGKWAEQILDFADQEQTNAPWLFDRLNGVAKDAVILHSAHSKYYPEPTLRFFYIKNPPELKTPFDYYKYAMEYIQDQSYGTGGSNSNVDEVVNSFKAAENLSLDEEQKSSSVDPAKRMSVAYKAMAQFTEALYEIHNQNWWSHY